MYNMHQIRGRDKILLRDTTLRLNNIIPDIDPNPLHVASMAEADRLVDLAKGRPAIDVGANVGGFVQWFLEKGLAPVHAFEPVPGPFEEMLAKYRGNYSVILNNAGLSDRCEVLEGLKVYNAWTLSNEAVNETVVPGRNMKMPEFSARMMVLDYYVDQQKITDVGFMKIDVDGYELKVLKGSIVTIGKFKPPILFEVSGLGERYFDDTREELADFIVKLGYVAVSMDGKYRVSDAKELLRCIPFHTTFDIMLVPR